MFHCRDVYWTQCADYFSATALVGTATLVAAHHALRDLPSAPRLHALAMPSLCLFAALGFSEHVRRMLVHFDYGAHLAINLCLGAAHLLLWIAWWAGARGAPSRTRRGAVRARPHAWRAPTTSALLCAAAVFELTDAPPLWGAIYGHALWHASTVPIAVLHWRAFVAVELRWQSGSSE